jgi:hypothetical protein
VAALNQQVAALTPHVAMLRGQTLQMQQCIETAHALLSMVGMHPTQSMRWCCEAIAVLEPELEG